MDAQPDIVRSIISLICGRKRWYLTVMIFLALLLPQSPSASGFRTTNLGAKATAMGNAFTATADNPSAIAYNPAGLTNSKGTNIYYGATAIILSNSYKSPSGISEDTDDQIFFPFHLYLSSDFGMESFVFGLGIFSPFGLGTKWGKNGVVKFLATESKMESIVINPTVAWQVLPTLSVGVGIDYMYSKARLKKRVDQSLFGAGDGETILEGDGDGWGYNIGILLTPIEKLSLGLTYRSGIEVDFDGSSTFDDIAPALQPLFGGPKFKTDASTSIDFPDVLSAGIAYSPIENLILELDIEWTFWSSYDRLDIDLEDEIPPAGFVDVTEVKNWRDVDAIKVGVEYLATERVSVRAGYVYDNSPAPDDTVHPRLPDSDQQNISLGLGYRRGKFNVDVVYIAAFYEDRKVDNTVLSGEYETFAHLFGFSIGYRF
jgi:long-chain fatty acid transport protein